MDVVERVIEADQWSTAKKTAVTALGFFLPGQIVQYLIARATFSGYVDMRWVDGIFACLIAASAVVGAAATLVARRGFEGHWTFYAFFGLFVAVTGTALYGFGTNAAVVMYPLLLPAVASAFLFDTRKCVGIAVLTFGIVGGLMVATAAGLEYAPAILDRSLDAQANAKFQFGGGAILGIVAVTVTAYGTIAAAAARRNRAALAETRDRLDQAVGLISKYVPAEVAAGILSGSEVPSEGYRRQKVTVFFSDIVGFTDLAEELEPEDLAQVLNEYFSEMTGIAERHHGTVDELQGDGLIILFGAPTHGSDHDHALDAVKMAAEMQEAIARLNERWQDTGITDKVVVRMGINTGVVTVGHFGSGGRMKYTVLGKHVNLASRIQAACEPGKVLMSHATWLLVRNDVEARSLGELEFKGIVRPVEVHELVA